MVVLFLIGVGLLPTRLSFVSFVILLALITWLSMGKRANPLRQFVWVYVVYFCGVIVVYQLAWFARARIAPVVILVLLAVAAAILLWLKRGHGPAAFDFRISSWLGILAALGICCYINLPVLLHPSSAAVLQQAARTNDDINHVTLVETDRQMQGYVYKASPGSARLLDPRMVGYPQGWHMNGAVSESFFVRLLGSDTVAHRLLSFLLYKTWWVFIATFFVYECALAAARTFFRQKSPGHIWLLGGGSFVLAAYLLVALYGYGFQNFIADTALFLAALCLIAKVLRARDSPEKRLGLLGLALVTVGIACVWVLPGAVAGLLLLVLVWYAWARDRGLLRVYDWALLAIAGLLALSQVYITWATIGTGQIDEGGAAPPLSSIGAIVFIVCALVLALVSPKVRKRYWLVFCLALASVEFLCLAAYQKVFLGKLSYYDVKLAFFAVIVTSAFVLALLSTRRVTGRHSLALRIGAVVGYVIIVPLLLGLNLKRSAFPIKNGVSIQLTTARQVLQAKDSNQGFVIYGVTKEETYLATKLYSEVQPYDSPQRQALLNDLQNEIGQ